MDPLIISGFDQCWIGQPAIATKANFYFANQFSQFIKISEEMVGNKTCFFVGTFATFGTLNDDLTSDGFFKHHSFVGSQLDPIGIARAKEAIDVEW
ncbi:hypothetical protein C8024_05580 [Sphingopyxis sp. BSNA05]|nr:hypothetical protein [Sphingopyxis sp. BSNA05]